MSKLIAGLLGLALTAAAPALISPARAANFDGTWSVLIITQSGDCDRAYRYPVRIANGRGRETRARADIRSTCPARWSVRATAAALPPSLTDNALAVRRNGTE